MLLLGIRHHGPGSARSLRRALEHMEPDLVLVEGPPDADAVLPLAAHAGMVPPVALLIYRPETPQQAVYYPFAVFSPEWQAIQFALTRGIPVRFMDLPQAYRLVDPEPADLGPSAAAEPAPDPEAQRLRADPLRYIAEQAGYSDSERWWEHVIEQRRQEGDVFQAVLELMTALRTEADRVLPVADPWEARREAYMRQTLRAARQEGFARIAVVTGAWHSPALTDLTQTRADAALLKSLPKVRVAATWVPWTHGRLAARTGYGAGVESPGWYQHLWQTEGQVAVRWMTRVARLLRGEDLDASSASVIEAVRLAETLAALRDRPLPGLVEMNEAAEAVFSAGQDAPLRLIQERLVTGEALGQIPDATPMVPLQRDLQSEQKRLRLPPDSESKTLSLDLRKPLDLARSHLLHRLNLLRVPWGKTRAVGRLKQGTFHEEWQLQWEPEYAVAVIEAAQWGNTVLQAAAALTRRAAEKARDLPALVTLVQHALWAEIPEALEVLMHRLQAEAAVANDVTHLMAALPPLGQLVRYGDVRQTEVTAVRQVVQGLVIRICVGLPAACTALNEEAAAAMVEQVQQVHATLRLLEMPDLREAWQAVLQRLVDQAGLHALLAGRCARLLLDEGLLLRDQAARRLSLALSPAVSPDQAAAWVEGFLKGSGLLLLHDADLWQILDEWVGALSSDGFTLVLPLLRRTFATFSAPERRQMGERVKRGAAAEDRDDEPVKVQWANAILPLVDQLLGWSADGIFPPEKVPGA